jgi:hypothetical protein
MKVVGRFPNGVKIINLPSNLADLAFVISDYFYLEHYQSLINQHGIPEILVADAHPIYPEIELLGHNTQYYYSPYFFKRLTNLLVSNCHVNDNCAPEYCFNFMINKKQINRYLLLKLVEWYDLSSYQHTWSGAGSDFDMSRIIEHFDLIEKHVDIDKFRNHMLSPVYKILPYFVRPDSSVNYNIQNISGMNNFGSLSWVWNNVVNNMFSKSVVSLITESIGYEKVMTFTEKTVYSVFGLTFPIWIGGSRQADLWKQFGFDTFDDVINHDYQHCDTLLERCFYAIHDNLQILTDLDYAKRAKQQHIERLKQNRILLNQNIKNVYNNSLLNLPIPNLWSILNTKTYK